MSHPAKSSLRHPRYWGSWLGLGVFYQLSRISWQQQLHIGSWLGDFIFDFVPIRRKIVETNLRMCFPDMEEQERQSVMRQHYRDMAIGLFETCSAWWKKIEHMPPFRIEGLEYLQTLKEQKKGALLLTAHFTTLEICGRFLSESWSICGLYRDPNNPVIAQHMKFHRDNCMSEAIDHENLRGLLRALRSGEHVWYASDQAKRTPLSILSTFFGHPAVTTTATSRICDMSGAVVVPYFAKRCEDGSYLLQISAPLENFPSEDVVADTRRINAIFETNIEQALSQYFWMHKRFKYREPDFPSPY